MLSRLELSLSPMCEHSGGCEGSLHRPRAANTAARLAGKLGSTARELRGGRSILRRGTRVALGKKPPRAGALMALLASSANRSIAQPSRPARRHRGMTGRMIRDGVTGP